MLERTMVQFLVDINGDKSPNVLGKDVFEFTFHNIPYVKTYKDGTAETRGQKGQLTGYYGYTDRTEAYNGCKNNGHSCSDLIILDGFKIKDDYPLEF